MIAGDGKQHPSDALIEAIRRRFPTEPLVDATLTAKMRRRAGGRHVPQPVAQVTERLRAFLARRVAGEFSVGELEALAGGSSKEQYAFRLRWTDEHDRPRDERLVLRMRPTASVVETHPLREYQALAAVRDAVPVPPLHWLDAEGRELGQPALVYGFCAGIARPPRDGAYNPRGGYGPKYRALLAPQFVRHFAALARLDLAGADLGAFEVPPAGSRDGVVAAINWWHRVWEEDCLERNPLITLAAEWLREHAPPIDRVSFVHQDLRGGNFLFDPADGRITAILDWELVQLGDRHNDLAYFLNPLFAETLDDGRVMAGGLLPREEFLATYERLSGLPVDPARLAYYNVFTCWRSAVIATGTAARVIVGQQTHQDLRVAWLLGTGPIVLGALRDALEEVAA